MGVEATDNLKRIDICIANVLRQPFSRTFGYIYSMISRTLVLATHRCIRGSMVTAHKISFKLLQWEDGALINLFR